VDGRPYADGGVSDPIPLRKAIQDGATDITVVLTHNPAFRLKPVSRWMGRFAYPDFPAVARVWTAEQNVHYNAALDLMKQPPAGVKIRVFRPMRQMPVGTFSVKPKEIAAAMSLGHDEAVEQMEIMEGKPVAVRVLG
jgi:predicted patatin/cPLA2 family phospholipase